MALSHSLIPPLLVTYNMEIEIPVTTSERDFRGQQYHHDQQSRKEQDENPLFDFITPTYTNSCVRLDRPSTYLLNKARRKNNFHSLQKSMYSKTVYIGGLLLSSTEQQIHALFVTCGKIQTIIMGLDRIKLAPCGFCFVVFDKQLGALNAVKWLNGTKLDDRELEIDLDPGFEEGRQYGRGVNGGQVSVEMKQGIGHTAREYDNGAYMRGGRDRGGRGRGRGRGRGGRGGQRPGGSSYEGSGYMGEFVPRSSEFNPSFGNQYEYQP
ncbi:hypothetical protein BABINDRAFT_161095 [Babjeviella inositovora NRRL Y-12698]|uniref:Nuclear cap-binding protein subunit 2 n=1 Tax=Babjeviella inositovora NRRL Y-12698 TaxID=984486 RepID=A0A1E3QQY9_9ASCO|nr:uncharacterized protein BABINDRAFT_161095 [Babjeviella inositovora NRRL Y-12698]ODQ80105.1 hypothetical protein BABINDRAFT_161095 [Babjeviella inositovora NRRL Y-12698]